MAKNKTTRTFKNICGRTIAVDAKLLPPDEYIEIDANKAVDLGILALTTNGYLREVE